MILLSACAGPMSPFGALNSWVRHGLSVGVKDGIPWDGKSTRVRFLPAHQILHGPVSFSVVIEDPDGVPGDFQLKLIYNGIDSSTSFLDRADRLYLDAQHRRLRLSLKNVRLLPARENKISAIYKRSTLALPVVASYAMPTCSAFAATRSLASIPDFEPPSDYIEMINAQAEDHGFNPYFVAGLIAQESGFDPGAISRGHALGLTQVTPVGEAEVLKHNVDWPQYPGVDEMPVALLRLSVLNGRVNADNEWRLNPALSIAGGVEYLTYLSEYWSRPEKRAQLETALGGGDEALSEVMLASYNSGATRVSAAIDLKGKSYLQDEQLGEARKYVRRVVSYCDYFASREE